MPSRLGPVGLLARSGALAAAAVVASAAPALAGDATFTPAPGGPLPAGESAGTLSIGDFNSDGRQDLAVTDRANDKLRIYLGAGDGTFTQPTGSPFGTVDQPIAAATGSFDNDSDEDLAILSIGNPGIVEIKKGAGNGTFSYEGGTNTQVAFPVDPVLGDFSAVGDNKLDLGLVSWQDGGVAVLLGNGSSFTIPAGSPFPVSQDMASLATGDFNSDGNEDLVTVESETGYRHDAVILFGAGNGSFSSAVRTDTGNLDPRSVVVGDFNADGKDDIATSDDRSPRKTSVMLGDGAGNLTEASGSPFDLDAEQGTLVVGDFNSDGREDLAGGTGVPSPAVNVVLGAGDGTFTKAPASPFGVDKRPRYLTVGDLNGDATEDIVSTSYEGGNVSILLGGGPAADTGNLLVNGGAESPGAGASAPHDYTVIAPPSGWTTTNGFSYLRYGVGVFPRRLLSTRFGGQESFFASGYVNGSAPSTASQTVSLAGEAAAIDAGRASVRLTGWLGGYRDVNESIGVTATFLDGGGQPVGSALAIGPVGVAERNKKTTFVRRSGVAAVPAGTRSVTVKITATHNSGPFYDSAYADRIGLFLSTDPETPPPGGSPPPGTPPPGSGSGSGDTKAPQTKITKRPRNRVRAATVAYRFKSSEKGSTFKCRVDRKRFRGCRSPLKLKHLKRGNHRFAVRATDRAGNTDKTPATDSFKRRR